MKKFIFLLIIFIIQASISQTLEVVSPNGGENYAGGDKVYITWQASAVISRVRIECSLNNGGEWYRIDSDCSEKSYRWVVPYIKLTTSQALIRITALDITNPPSDLSDAPFTITAAPPDPYEPNNTLNEAYNADVNDTLWGAMTMNSTSDPNSEDIDFFKFTLGDASLIELKTLPDFRDTIDSGNIYIGFNDGTSKPILTLYDSTGGYLQEGYGEMSYNASYGGTYYCRVDSSYNGWGIWHKYGFFINTTTVGSINVQNPNGGETYNGGEKIFITWEADSAITRVKIECSLNNGGEWFRLASYFSEKSYRWVVPYIKNTSSQVLIRVTAEDISNPPSDISDAPFTITAASPDPYEPNNTLNEAYKADINDTLWGAMTMKSSSDPNSEDIDFFKFTLDDASLIELKVLPDFRDTIDTGNIYVGFNDGTSKPILTLYNSTGGYLEEGYGELSYNASSGGTYYCRVDSAYNGWRIWHKYGFFINTSTIGSINIQSPNGGETFEGGDKVYITWQAGAGISRFRIECSFNNGGEWYHINSDYSQKSYRWVVPYIKLTSSQALIRITALDITNPPSDLSDAPFTITAAPPDPYEPNNTLNEAYKADINDTLWGVMTMKSSSDPNSEDIDFFQFTVDNASLMVLEALPDFIDTIDTGNIYVGFNDGTSKPILTLYDSTGGYIEEGYGKITYNTPSGGAYYCRVDSSYNGWCIWHKYGLRVMSILWKEVDEIQINTDDYDISVDPGGDTVYTAKKSGQNTKLDIDLSLDKREQGLVIAGIFDTNTVFPVPDTLLQVKTISIDAPDVFDASLKYADIVIPYSEDELGTIPESSLAVYALNDLKAFNGLGWEPVSFTHDQVNNKLFVHVTNLNILSVFGVDNTIDIINTPSILPRLSTMHIGYNPRNGFVTIKYQLASEGIAKLEVYNTMGKKVYTIFDSNRKAGYYATRWSGGIMSAGIYYFKLTTLNSRIVKKAVVIK